MPRLFKFPNPNDRSPNQPAFIVKSDQIIGLYNKYKDDDMKNVTSKVQDWFADMAKEYQWDDAEFVGSECILKVKLEMRKVPQE